MSSLQNVSVTKTIESNYIKPLSINYTLEGVKKRWDLIETHDSVAVILFNKTRNVLIFVKQFRPAVYYSSIPKEDKISSIDTSKYPISLGMTVELCAGIIDKDKSLEEIAREEVLEECGYDVPLTNLRKVKTYRSGVGSTGAPITLFYAEVTDDMRVSEGGGLKSEGEFIEVVEMSMMEAKTFFGQTTLNVPPGCLFAVFWFFQQKDIGL